MKMLNDIADFLLLKNEPIYEHNIEVKGIEVDSRKVNPGDLFVCISGYTVDGHDFIDQAIDQGAVAIMAEKPLDRKEIPIIYVEDTNESLSFLANYFYDF